MAHDELSLETRSGLPDALRVLLENYPRESWQSDAGFSDLVRFWLERHLMFRRVVDIMIDETEEALDQSMDLKVYASHLARYGGFFMQELHTHHVVEDQQYFPRLRGMEDRLSRGFDILDRDHRVIDQHLDAFEGDVRSVFGVLKGSDDPRKAIEVFANRLSRTHHLLDRHLTDEEELIVPVILKHAPSGVV